MRSYLVFRLYGPMASWGLPAVGGDRQTAVAPSRSAILGLLGAALGIRRDNETQLQALQQSVEIAVKQLVPGTLIRDYHTTQVPSADRKFTHRTRKSELSESHLNTVLSSRDYRCDGMWTVAVTLTPEPSYTLAELHSALKTPVFSLYLGRKSCPPAAPLSPQIVADGFLRAALDTEFHMLTWSQKADDFLLRHNGWVTYFWEKDPQAIEPEDSETVVTTFPWDEPENRGRWQFQSRTMYQLSVAQSRANKDSGSSAPANERV
ncbi:type I-E CRISPR-associated protein Cas5/CasD [Vibrio gazogenes]|uniref:CRISPR-associated protein, Cas5e family n=1 Tax=Vibrio gazogenes DSM 21264 = NBRC 103151 TaxID=1123492 RepID=A0A1M5CD18_VIBGA|nr:type I-E CRISPR-associated protein Cas5/CasD [Vibrio gazogenes]USP16238.1 type I-E CRISPR-associated protein Cas5/CasD [Vibrio gazogenes]SHF52497.1 CRISPR-associated protein, Cas5e family [Vibrio gazogenes DSM 21264] [Vibrio gazogenes DSM 21264 = NBRC 103151]SJN53172.1 CRISPR system Cascade subunit CasD [Vibrio gazogenes]